jgi:2-hydroxycyclohexanecarboxyl-CoA dehydrogenase
VARHGITANSVCPGPTETPPLKKMVAEGGDKYITAMVRGIPLGRLGQPTDVAAAVAFFASGEAAFITGQTLSVSGGMSMV